MNDRSQRQVDDRQKNSNYEHDINYTLSTCRWILKAVGLWPLVYNRTSKLEKLVSVVLLIVCFSCLLSYLVPSVQFFFFVDRAVKTKLVLGGPVIFTLSSTIKYCYIIFKGTFFQRCIVHVDRDWRTVTDANHRNIMLRYTTISRNLSTLCAVFLYSSGFSYNTVVPIFSKGKVVGNQTVKSFTSPVYDVFFDTQSSPTYEIIYCAQLMTAFVRYSVTVASFSLAVICVTHICGQIQIQIARLEDLVGWKQEKSSHHDPLGIIIRDHVATLRFSTYVEEAIREICLVQVLESTFLLCIVEYTCVTDWTNLTAVGRSTYCLYLVTFTFIILIFCYIGEIMSEQCSQIGPASYEIDWYNFPPKKACDLILLNVVSLHPPKLTAGKIIDLSLNTFVTVVRSSVVYLNLLRTFTE